MCLRISLFWSFSIMLSILIVCHLQYIRVQTQCVKSWMFTNTCTIQFWIFIHDLDNFAYFPAAQALPCGWHNPTAPTLAPKGLIM